MWVIIYLALERTGEMINYGGLPKWLKGPVLKTGRSLARRQGSNP